MIRMKVWAVRVGVLALVTAGFGGVSWCVFQCISAGIVGAFFGVALFGKRAWRVGAGDIAF